MSWGGEKREKEKTNWFYTSEVGDIQMEISVGSWQHGRRAVPEPERKI